MKRKLLLAFASIAMLAGSTMSAEVVVRVGPPRPIVERRLARPGRGYVWTPGYQRWDGGRYAWSPGAWVQPPRPHAVWVPHRWVRRGGSWVFVEGRWR